MKKYSFIAIIAIGSFTASCTNDENMSSNSIANPEVKEFDSASMQKDLDSTEYVDTGGQGGSIPIKPPKP